MWWCVCVWGGGGGGGRGPRTAEIAETVYRNRRIGYTESLIIILLRYHHQIFFRLLAYLEQEDITQISCAILQCTVQILCIGTDRSQQTVQTKNRLLLKKQSDQGLCCSPFHQHLLDALMRCYIKLFNF